MAPVTAKKTVDFVRKTRLLKQWEWVVTEDCILHVIRSGVSLPMIIMMLQYVFLTSQSLEIQHHSISPYGLRLQYWVKPGGNKPHLQDERANEVGGPETYPLSQSEPLGIIYLQMPGTLRAVRRGWTRHGQRSRLHAGMLFSPLYRHRI